jgi:hypothetical protein
MGMNNNIFLSQVYIGSFGSSLGYCLANINNYSSSKEFLADFGKQATVNGSVMYVATTVPLLGSLIMLGGLG